MPYLVIGVTVAFGMLTVAFPHRLPRMHGAGPIRADCPRDERCRRRLVPCRRGGFLARDLRRTGRPEHQLLATLAILFGLAEMMFLISAPWESEWWTWHVVRFAAYVLALTYVSRGYVRTVSDVRRSLAQTKRSERRLAAEYAVTRIMAESATIKDATHGVLRAVGENLDWEVGMFWGDGCPEAGPPVR